MIHTYPLVWMHSVDVAKNFEISHVVFNSWIHVSGTLGQISNCGDSVK